MANYLLKRTKTKVNRAAVGIIGPVDENGGALDGASWQECDFYGPNGSLANIELTVGKRYKVGADLWGDKGGDLALEIQAQGTAAFKKIGSVKIPANPPGDRTHVGYYHWDTFLFTV